MSHTDTTITSTEIISSEENIQEIMVSDVNVVFGMKDGLIIYYVCFSSKSEKSTSLISLNMPGITQLMMSGTKWKLTPVDPVLAVEQQIGFPPVEEEEELYNEKKRKLVHTVDFLAPGSPTQHYHNDDSTVVLTTRTTDTNTEKKKKKKKTTEKVTEIIGFKKNRTPYPSISDDDGGDDDDVPPTVLPHTVNFLATAEEEETATYKMMTSIGGGGSHVGSRKKEQGEEGTAPTHLKKLQKECKAASKLILEKQYAITADKPLQVYSTGRPPEPILPHSMCRILKQYRKKNTIPVEKQGGDFLEKFGDWSEEFTHDLKFNNQEIPLFQCPSEFQKYFLSVITSWDEFKHYEEQVNIAHSNLSIIRGRILWEYLILAPKVIPKTTWETKIKDHHKEKMEKVPEWKERISYLNHMSSDRTMVAIKFYQYIYGIFELKEPDGSLLRPEIHLNEWYRRMCCDTMKYQLYAYEKREFGTSMISRFDVPYQCFPPLEQFTYTAAPPAKGTSKSSKSTTYDVPQYFDFLFSSSILNEDGSLAAVFEETNEELPEERHENKHLPHPSQRVVNFIE